MLVCGRLVERFGYRPLIVAALAGVGVSLILVSRATEPQAWLRWVPVHFTPATARLR